LTKTLSTHERTVRLQLWDTAGQERFRSLIPSYIRDSGVAVVIYDITGNYGYNYSYYLYFIFFISDSKTFAQTDRWVSDVRTQRGDEVVIILVGNKTDLNDRREVSTEEGETKAHGMRALFMETSAKTGFNVKKMFTKMVNNLPNNTNDENLKKEVEIQLRDANNTVVNPINECNYC